MRVYVPVPDAEAGQANGPEPTRRVLGAIGVIDNSKPRFDVLAAAALDSLVDRGFSHAGEHYVRKPSPTRPAEPGEIERLSNGTVAVIVGSGD